MNKKELEELRLKISQEENAELLRFIIKLAHNQISMLDIVEDWNRAKA